MAEAVLDANILLRYLTNEPRPLAAQVADILEAAERRLIRLVVAPLTLAEVVFVLESSYGWKRRDIADRLLSIFAASVIDFLEQDTVMRAVTWYRDTGSLHFADAYVAALAASRGSPVISLDRALKRVRGLTVVDRADDLP